MRSSMYDLRSVKISVITPSLNRGGSIRAAIESVLRQKGASYEHIVVDGGSTDRTSAVLDAYPEVIVRHARRIERMDAMTIGLRLATGEIIVCLNADEQFADGAFASVLSAFERGAQAVMGNVRVRDEKQCWINTAPGDFAHLMRHWERNAFCLSPAALFVRRHLLEIWHPDPLDNQGSNLDLQLYLSSHGGIVKIETVLAELAYPASCKQRRHQDSPSFWHEKQFPFLRKYLVDFQGNDRADFLRHQRYGYQTRRHQAIENARQNGTLDRLIANGEAIPLLPEKKLFCAPGDTVAAICDTDTAQALHTALAQTLGGRYWLPVLTFGAVPLNHETAFLSDPEESAHRILETDPVLTTCCRTRNHVHWYFFIAWNDRLTEADLLTFQWTCGLLTGNPDRPVVLKPNEPFAILEGTSSHVCLYRKKALNRTASLLFRQFLGIPK